MDRLSWECFIPNAGDIRPARGLCPVAGVDTRRAGGWHYRQLTSPGSPPPAKREQPALLAQAVFTLLQRTTLTGHGACRQRSLAKVIPC